MPGRLPFLSCHRNSKFFSTFSFIILLSMIIPMPPEHNN
jgi:hypothetical protein